MDWALNPTSTATATLLHRNAATSPHGHCVNVADSNRADLNCDGSSEGDPFIVAGTVLKLSNGVATARPPFKKPAACKLFKHDPGTLLIDRTKYASGVPGETLFMYGIHLLQTR